MSGTYNLYIVECCELALVTKHHKAPCFVEGKGRAEARKLVVDT